LPSSNPCLWQYPSSLYTHAYEGTQHEVIGLRTRQSRATTHYLLLDRQNYLHMAPGAIKSYDPNNLPLCHHTTLMAQVEEVQNTTTCTDANKLAKLYGIKGVPYLSLLPSLNFSKSFPYDFMHLILENLIKNLVLHWTGEFKHFGVVKKSYEFPTAVWNAIREVTGKSGSTIPSAFGSCVPNVATHQSQMSAEMWSFWTLYLGPVLLR
jgi:hypothetical protein